MRCKLVLFITLLATNTYTGPLTGRLSTQKFSFTHMSDWQNEEIVNRVQNRHSTDPLVVLWPEGLIFAPVERPIPTNRSDVNSYSCPDSSLDRNDHAELLYGLSSTRKTAGVYRLAQTKSVLPVLRSEIIAADANRPFRLEVISTWTGGSSVQYVFLQNRRFSYALPLSSEHLSYFEKAGWKIEGRFSDVLKLTGPITERIRDLKAYFVLAPQRLKSAVVLPFAPSQIRAEVVLIADEDRRVVASGFISLHAR